MEFLHFCNWKKFSATERESYLLKTKFMRTNCISVFVIVCLNSRGLHLICTQVYLYNYTLKNNPDKAEGGVSVA